MTADDAKKKLIAAGKILAMEDQGEFTRGHISVRHPDNPSTFLMKPHSVGLDEITMDNILRIDLDGNVVAGTARRHSEVYIHSEIYRARPDVICVIHSHPAAVVAFSATGRPLRPLSQPSALFVDALPVYDGSIDLIRSQVMGRDVASSLGPHKVVIMKNHGIAATGRTIEEAVITTLMLDEAARIQLLADAAGGTAPEFPMTEVMQLRDKLSRLDQFEVNFNYLERRIQQRNGS